MNRRRSAGDCFGLSFHLFLLFFGCSTISGRILITLCPFSATSYSSNSAAQYQYLIHCDHPVAILSDTDSFHTFKERVCEVMVNSSLLVTQHHLSFYRQFPSRLTMAIKREWKPRSMMFWAYILMLFGLENYRPLIEDAEYDAADLWLEFGVNKGYSINVTSSLKRIKMQQVIGNNSIVPPAIYGFDSFLGLPSGYNVSGIVGYDAGYFSQNGTVPFVREDITLVAGWFNETLQTFLQQHSMQHQISFVNIDNDLYDGTYFILESIFKRLRQGALLHFHELYVYSSRDRNKPFICHSQPEMVALYDFLIQKSKSSSDTSLKYRLRLIPARSTFKQSTLFIVTAAVS